MDALRDYGYISRNELEVIARSPELSRAWEAKLAGDAQEARAGFEAASRSPREAVAAFAQIALVEYAAADLGQAAAACSQLAERFRESSDATVRGAAIHALISAARLRPQAGLEALREAVRSADDDPELRVTAAEGHLEIARWWLLRHEEAVPHDWRAADAHAHRALEEYDVVISRAGDANEPALQVIVQFARNEKTQLLTDMHDWGHDITSSEQAIATPVPPGAPALLRLAVAQAWLIHGSLLFARNDTTAAAAEALAELGRLFGNDPSPQVQNIVRQGRQLEQRARHTHRRSRYGWTWVSPHVDIRIPFLGVERQVWGRKAWTLWAAVVLVLALLGLWPVSRRLLETANAVSDARERALDTVSTAVFVVAAAALALGWLVLNARKLLHGESARWRQLGVGLVLALALAGLIFAGGRITGLFG